MNFIEAYQLGKHGVEAAIFDAIPSVYVSGFTMIMSGETASVIGGLLMLIGMTTMIFNGLWRLVGKVLSRRLLEQF